MKSFLDTLSERKYDLTNEIIAIEDLLHKRNRFNYNIISCFRDHFLDWSLRNNYVDFELFLSESGLSRIIKISKSYGKISIDQFVFYAEYVLNLLLFVESESFYDYVIPTTDNIENVLEQLNYKCHNDKNGNIHIVPNDVLVSEAAEITQDTYDLGESIYAYNYRQLSGDLNAKSDILCRLYKYYETIENQAKQYGYTTLAEDVSHLSNKLDVRHAATPKQEIILGSMTKDEIEEWYDELFRMYLSLIVLVDYKKRRKDINELKSKLG